MVVASSNNNITIQFYLEQRSSKREMIKSLRAIFSVLIFYKKIFYVGHTRIINAVAISLLP